VNEGRKLKPWVSLELAPEECQIGARGAGKKEDVVSEPSDLNKCCGFIIAGGRFPGDRTNPDSEAMDSFRCRLVPEGDRYRSLLGTHVEGLFPDATRVFPEFYP